MEFRSVRFEYRRQQPDGSLGAPATFDWDIRQGTVSTDAVRRTSRRPAADVDRPRRRV